MDIPTAVADFPLITRIYTVHLTVAHVLQRDAVASERRVAGERICLALSYKHMYITSKYKNLTPTMLEQAVTIRHTPQVSRLSSAPL